MTSAKQHWYVDNRVVHSSHFWLIFGFIFGSFSGVWQKNNQNEPKNDVKNDVKNGYCERSEMQTFRKWSKNAFYLAPAVLGTFKLHLKGLREIIIVSS